MLQKELEAILNRLCDKYGSDKGSELTQSDNYWHLPHNYTKVYASLFHRIKDNNLIIFECGLGTNNPTLSSSMGPNGKPGASLRVWRDFFPNAQVYGADIDRDTLFLEERIITDYMDQTDPESVKAFWSKHDIYPNVIIDDGLHEYDAGVCLFENSIDRLSDNGIYVIEDILKEDLPRYQEYFQSSGLDVMFISINRTGIKLNDNTLIVIFK